MGRTAQDFLSVMQSWVGKSEANGGHKEIIDLYNSVKPLPRSYAVKYNDEWCDTTISAAGIAAGMSDLIGRECGCQEHIAIFKELGIWEEDGTITPKAGYIILYNWDDGTQPNDGWADHIGVVEKVSKGKITLIEGNYKNAVGRRTIDVGDGRIRGYAMPKYEAAPKKTTTAAKDSLEDVAKAVIAGKYGTGTARKANLAKAGYDYAKVQAKVNELLAATKKAYSGKFPTLPQRGYFMNGDGYRTLESYNGQIKLLQKFLNWAINAGLKVDGKYGDNTEKAVKLYQEKYNLTQDGKFGSKSLAKAKTIKK